MSAPTQETAATYPHSLDPSDSERFDFQQSLPAAIHARRDEFTRPHNVRIKVGTWNIAACKNTDKDLGAWFVGSKGVAERLAGLPVTSSNDTGAGAVDQRESVAHQENRYTPKESTIPHGDRPAVPGNEEIGIYALGLQELVDITSATEALRPYSDPASANRFKKAMEESLPAGYVLVAEQQLIGLLLLVYASAHMLPHITSVSTTSVGTGLMGYMGNKGAVTARLILGETTRLVFINSHMSAGSTKADLERRNWDAAQIISRTRFDPVINNSGTAQEFGERIGDEDLAFWFGDLNYRLEGVPGDDVRRLLMLHTKNEYDVGNRKDKEMEEEIIRSAHNLEIRQQEQHYPNNNEALDATSLSPVVSQGDGQYDQISLSSAPTLNTLDGLDEAVGAELDPASLQATISSLLAHDELYQQQRTHKAFADGWREGPITFLPTYKYDIGSFGMFDSSEKKRAPSWCDRILYRTRNDKLAYDKAFKDAEDAKKKDKQMKDQGLDQAVEDESTLFDYDPDADGEDEDEENEQAEPMPLKVHTKEGFDDTIALEHYLAHQRVLSSDHKPLDAIFKLKYDAVVPELRAKVHQEVARELDKAENEGRPTVTVVIEGEMDGDSSGPNGVNFGKIRYNEPKVQHITLANTGLVPTVFGFVDGLEEATSKTTPEWLLIDVDHTPNKESAGRTGPGDLGKTFTLEPGETCDVMLTALVQNMPLVRDLNEGKSLDDVVVLRVQEGRDHFIGVRGLWQETSIGSTIDKLIRLPEGGVRLLQRQKPEARNQSTSLSSRGDEDNVKWSVPREIFRLTESIEVLVERIIAEWSILGHELQDQAQPPWQKHAGWPFEEDSWTLPADGRSALLIDLFEALDTTDPFDAHLPPNLPPLHRLELFADALLIFLRSLHDGVIPVPLWRHLEETYFSRDLPATKLAPEDRKARILEVISTSPNHSVAFVVLTSMLARVAKEVVSSVEDLPPATRASIELPSSPVRRKALSLDPDVARAQVVRKSYALLFADVLLKGAGASEGARWKLKKGGEERKSEIIEVFLEG